MGSRNHTALLLDASKSPIIADIISGAQLFEDPATGPSTRPSEEPKGSQANIASRPRGRGARTAQHSGAQIQSTISRDQKEVDLSYLTFTSDDVGAAAERVPPDVAVGSNLQHRESNSIPPPAPLSFLGVPATMSDSLSTDSKRNVKPKHGFSDAQALLPPPRSDLAQAIPPAAQKLRPRHSLPELTANTLGTEHLRRRLIERTYLEHVSDMRLRGTNAISQLIERLMGEVSSLRIENSFLGEQLAIRQQHRDHLNGEKNPTANMKEDNHRSHTRERLVRTRRATSISTQSTPSSDDSRYEMSAPHGSSTHKVLGAVPNPITMSAGYQVLHRVICNSRIHTGYFRTLPPQIPFPVRKKQTRRDYRLHLLEQGLVVHPENLQEDYPETKFLVLRYYTCREAIDQSSILPSLSVVPLDETGETTSRATIPTWAEECITYMSGSLSSVLIGRAECDFNERDTSIDIMQLNMLSPYNFLFHHRSSLASYALQRRGTIQEDLNTLFDYFNPIFGADFDSADELFAQGLVNTMHLGKLFKPNSLIVSKEMDQAFIISSWPQQRQNRLNLDCWSWKYNGAGFVRQTTSCEVFCESEEPMPIDHLGFYPFRYAEEAKRNRILKRGQTYWNIKDPGLISYTGKNVDGTEYHHKERFMIDFDLHKKYHPTSEGFLVVVGGDHGNFDRFDPWPKRLVRGVDLDPQMLMIMPSTISGFNFRTKSWELLKVENISNIEWNKTAFSRLVLPSRTKDLIRAMIVDRKVERHSSDIFYGKGKGLIMLLHGPPGTGKTLSAESVAELAEKPLYRVTCGDIGTEIEDVEEYLEKILVIGKRWDCVLLLDEADVFLEERSLADLKRNSLVSVFLRVLEYYEGILILTSNRVGIFDEAFKSRIQVALHYTNLPRSARKQVWSNFFELLQEDEVEADFADMESHLDELAEVEMNGRQIRNAVSTARQLAGFQKQPLGYEHIESVIKTAGDFNRYIEKVHGHKDDRWARDGGLR